MDYKTINDPTKRKAVKYLQETYCHLEGEEKTQSMHQNCEDVSDALSCAIETLEKDIVFNPR